MSERRIGADAVTIRDPGVTSVTWGSGLNLLCTPTNPTPASKGGPRYLRWALIEAARHAARSPYYWLLYEQTKTRLGRNCGSKIARITGESWSSVRRAPQTGRAEGGRFSFLHHPVRAARQGAVVLLAPARGRPPILAPREPA